MFGINGLAFHLGIVILLIFVVRKVLRRGHAEAHAHESNYDATCKLFIILFDWSA